MKKEYIKPSTTAITLSLRGSVLAGYSGHDWDFGDAKENPAEWDDEDEETTEETTNIWDD